MESSFEINELFAWLVRDLLRYDFVQTLRIVLNAYTGVNRLLRCTIIIRLMDI